MVIKIWDAINDPLIGWLSDHTKSRWGPRIPWMVAASVPLGLSLAATFSLILSLFSSVAYAEKLVARMSGHLSPKQQSAIHSQIFADEVTKRSNGRLTIEFYPSKQL